MIRWVLVLGCALQACDPPDRRCTFRAGSEEGVQEIHCPGGNRARMYLYDPNRLSLAADAHRVQVNGVEAGALDGSGEFTARGLLHVDERIAEARRTMPASVRTLEVRTLPEVPHRTTRTLVRLAARHGFDRLDYLQRGPRLVQSCGQAALLEEILAAER